MEVVSREPSPLTDFSSQSSRLKSFDARGSVLHIELVPEHRAFRHWFDFTASFDRDLPAIDVCIDNAAMSAYAAGWKDYRPYVRRGAWVRNEDYSEYSDGRFRFHVAEPGRVLRAAWYEPYDVSRAQQFMLTSLTGLPDARVDTGADEFTVARIGDDELPRITIIARQHPGETIGSFFVEGLVNELLGNAPARTRLLREFSLTIMPVINVDGVRQHRHRYDDQDHDYNRCWSAASPPAGVAKVKSVLRETDRHALLIDVHGDEVSKINYVIYRGGKRASGELAVRYRALLGLISDTESNTYVWPPQPYIKRIAKRILREHRFDFSNGTTAGEYMASAQRRLGLTYELSASVLTPDQVRDEGTRFMRNLAAALGRSEPSGDGGMSNAG